MGRAHSSGLGAVDDVLGIIFSDDGALEPSPFLVKAEGCYPLDFYLRSAHVWETHCWRWGDGVSHKTSCPAVVCGEWLIVLLTSSPTVAGEFGDFPLELYR